MSKDWWGDDDNREKCYVCSNRESENYGLMTAYDDCCEEHERR